MTFEFRNSKRSLREFRQQNQDVFFSKVKKSACLTHPLCAKNLVVKSCESKLNSIYRTLEVNLDTRMDECFFKVYVYIYTVSFQIWLSWISMFFKCHKEYHLFIFGVGFEWCIVLRSSSHVFTTTAPVVQRALWLYSTSSPPPLARRMRGCAPSSGDFMASFSSVNFCENPRAHPGMPFPPPRN